MINSVKGILSAKKEGLAYIENSVGMEWTLLVSGQSLSTLPSIGSEVKLFTWLYHKEDQMALYGFATEAERFLFLDLISVSGVGPKGALKILSAATASQIANYLETEDLAGLSSLPGLGKKTAQKVILQLRGKLTQDLAPRSSAKATGPEAEWIESLGAMGFDKGQAKQVIKDLLQNPEIEALPTQKRESEILRRAIIELST